MMQNKLYTDKREIFEIKGDIINVTSTPGTMDL